MSTATSAQPSIFSPKHPVSVTVVEAIKNFMKVQNVSKADIVANSHLTARSLDKKLNHKSLLMVRDIFAIARVLDVSPSALFAAADNH